MSLDPPDAADLWATSSADWPLDVLLGLKGSNRVAVVIPARNEERTIGGVVHSIRSELSSLVDDLVVMDSLSSDDTARMAAHEGARVCSVADVRPDLGVRAGKGEALWKSQFVTTADVVAFIDADLTEWGPHFVRGVVGPLLADARVQLCRGFYDRVLDVGDAVTLEGGRVTELVARPWLALFRPDLAEVVQPLAGEWAIRASMLRELSIPMGYGVEIATLLDVHARSGVRGVAQVDLGRRAHRHQNIHDLGAMALEVLAAADRRRSATGYPSIEQGPGGGPVGPEVELRSMSEARQWTAREICIDERPPFATMF